MLARMKHVHQVYAQVYADEKKCIKKATQRIQKKKTSGAFNFSPSSFFLLSFHTLHSSYMKQNQVSRARLSREYGATPVCCVSFRWHGWENLYQIITLINKKFRFVSSENEIRRRKSVQSALLR